VRAGTVELNWGTTRAEGIGTTDGVTETDGEDNGNSGGVGVGVSDGEGDGEWCRMSTTAERPVPDKPPATRVRLSTEVVARYTRAWESNNVVQLLDDAL
jgi:hypothetical protein